MLIGQVHNDTAKQRQPCDDTLTSLPIGLDERDTYSTAVDGAYASLNEWIIASVGEGMWESVELLQMFP